MLDFAGGRDGDGLTVLPALHEVEKRPLVALGAQQRYVGLLVILPLRTQEGYIGRLIAGLIAH